MHYATTYSESLSPSGDVSSTRVGVACRREGIAREFTTRHLDRVGCLGCLAAIVTALPGELDPGPRSTT